MTDFIQRLQSALGSAFAIERELGGGGMSRVFLARETALGRHVVIKTLPPDLAAGVNSDRFHLEVQVAAQLHHPHIVPIHNAGAADGILYYTMPLIEGESLRARLARDGELPIADAVRILRDVADALDYAHQRGIVHRDIKPDNVLLSGQHAVVTDFGVAKALVGALIDPGGRTLADQPANVALTGTGIALGTPAYMAPEQAAGDPRTDHRADIYATGALAYEMLTGRAPFANFSPQGMLAAHLTEIPDPVTRHRSSVPPELATLVMRCLEKRPADRPRSAGELRATLDSLVTTGGSQPRSGAATRSRRLASRPVLALAAGLVIVALGAAWALRGRDRPTELATASNVIAVLPFRVAGASPGLKYLHEGMIDLLAAKLTGDGGPRAVDPRSAVSAWRRAVASDGEELSQEAALGIARQLGAGQLLLGGVVGTSSNIVLNATVLGVPGGKTHAQASAEGPSDSLPALVDQLAAKLLSLGAGEGEHRLSALTSTSLPALRDYLDGQSAYRSARFEDARVKFKAALEKDSTFALAALGSIQTAGWINAGNVFQDIQRGNRLAWASRHRLSERDRVYLAAVAGRRYPDRTPERERVEDWERAVQQMPDRSEAWFQLGDRFFHSGPGLGISEAHARAASHFRKALELDPTYAPAIDHLVHIALRSDDTATIRKFGTLYLVRDSVGETADFLRWIMTATLADSVATRAFRNRFDSLTATGLSWIAGVSQEAGIALPDADRAAAILRQRMGTEAQREEAFWLSRDMALNQGRPAAALRYSDVLKELTNPLPLARELVRDALYWDGDSAAAERAVQLLDGRIRNFVPNVPGNRRQLYETQCDLGQWRLWHGQTAEVAQTIAGLRSVPATDSSVSRTVASNCILLLEALMEGLQGRSRNGIALARLDSLLLMDPSIFPQYANLLVARLHEMRGNPSAALAATRRRRYGLRVPQYLSTYLREEGRLAAATGDREGAIRAYSHYLALRENAEPSLAHQVAQVRAEFQKLIGEPRR